ncbi:hypothetical protein ABT116_49805, partial [Streptomyces sp. NPDC002130]|uniref:hypothetical protein n=1 Tax=Streptomyces sp. NPDC002130 TaxID=3155568 RepID=UPI003326CC0D
MATIRPDDQAIDAAARHYGITLDQTARLEWTALIDGALGSYAHHPGLPGRDGQTEPVALPGPVLAAGAEA